MEMIIPSDLLGNSGRALVMVEAFHLINRSLRKICVQLGGGQTTESNENRQ
jgi:hypothetical protein